MAQVVSIKQRTNAANFPFSDIFIEHEGNRFHSRDFFVADTPANRAFLANAFLERLKRFPSGAAAKIHKPAHGGYPDPNYQPVSFPERVRLAREPKKPSFSIVRNT
jgi:hypothetical protein